VFAHVILARIRPTLLRHRRPQQSGFTPGRSTCDRIATLCNIAQRRQDFVHPTFAAYVDLRAAFDSLSRPALWLLLTRLGISDRALYDHSVSCIRTRGIQSPSFNIESGVRQGCVLAPDSFATSMDWLLERRSDRAQRRFRLVRPHLLTWILPTMSLSLPNYLNFSFRHWS